ncbi:MAG TPA: 4'-phosphopantetheinyl transferase superfamily protein [Marmoricola sp.]
MRHSALPGIDRHRTDGPGSAGSAVVVRWADQVDAADLLLAEAAELLGRPAFVEHRCVRCGADDHGQPYLVGVTSLHVSLARAGGLGIVALSTVGRVGVDLEREDAAGFDGFAEAALHPDERVHTTQEATRLWVRKEALLKATGRGLTVDPRQVRLSESRQPPALLHWAGADDPGPAWLADVPVTEGWLAAVAVLGPVRHDLGLSAAPSTLVGAGRHALR